MKKMSLVVLFALATVCASAQYKGDVAVDSLGGIMVKKGGTLVLDGVKILGNNAPAVMAEDYDRWRKADLGYKIGKGLTITGSALLATSVGCITYILCYDSPTVSEDKSLWEVLDELDKDYYVQDKLACIATIASYAAIPCILAGVPTLCVYNSRLKQLATDYNEGHRSQDISLSFGGQNNGIGFALNF
ncbi:MAG: hypothetical protein IKY36_01810 [Bacteroidales bacterium]|nr:hypothetical protein [Bacteroidales bacterium]